MIAYFLVLLLTALAILVSWRSLDPAARWIGLLGISALLNELIALAMGMNGIDFSKLYYIYSCIGWLFICLYFNTTIPFLNKGNKAATLGWVSSMAMLITLLLISDAKDIMDVFQIGASICTILFSALSLLSIISQGNAYNKPRYSAHFWIPLILLFFECGTFSGWIYEALVHPTNNMGINIAQAMLLSVNIIGFAALAILFFVYPKLQKDVYNTKIQC